MKRSLNVWINEHFVGVLSDENNIWSFQYAQEWLDFAESFDLSPTLPQTHELIQDGSSTRPVQWFFDNLLPEEGARELLSKEAETDISDIFSLLEYYGKESAGAITLLTEGEELSAAEESPLPNEVLSDRIKNLPVVSLSSGSTKRMSLAGAQHKLAVIYREEELYEPIGSKLSTHILKPDHSQAEHYPHSVANEWFIMTLADYLGLSVPKVYIKNVPEPVYIIERFDRYKEDRQLKRIHALDACQVLTLQHGMKYTQSTLKNLNEFIDFCRNKAVTRQRIFLWNLFNTIVGNGDAHLKNLSVLCNKGGMELSPHYDLLCTSVYEKDHKWGEAKLSWEIGKAQRFSEVTRNDMLAFGLAIGLKQRYIYRTMDKMVMQINHKADELVAQLENDELNFQLHAGELRTIRLITKGVITDSVRQLMPKA
jgi:serine/threonine-protein kinase HipA